MFALNFHFYFTFFDLLFLFYTFNIRDIIFFLLTSTHAVICSPIET